MNALEILCAQLTRDLFAIAKFLFLYLMILKYTYELVFHGVLIANLYYHTQCFKHQAACFAKLAQLTLAHSNE